MELLQEAEFWVGVALVLFFALLVKLKVPAAATGALDAHAQRIQSELDEAQRLRGEAERLLAEIRTQREAAERQAADMLAQAQADAKRIAEDSARKLEEQIRRRGELAERKIATAEAQAAAEVKAAAADLATQAAETILADRIAGAKSDPLVDRAIAQLGAKLK